MIHVKFPKNTKNVKGEFVDIFPFAKTGYCPLEALRRIQKQNLGHPDEARRIHRGEIAPSAAKPAEWPNVAEFAAANAAEESCGNGGCGCK